MPILKAIGAEDQSGLEVRERAKRAITRGSGKICDYSICRDGMGKKWRPYIARTKSYVQNSALIIVTEFYEPYHGISSVFISNKTVSVARMLRWSTKPASRHTRGARRNRTLLSDSDSSFFRQASSITAEAITMIQAQTSWIFSGVLHSQHSFSIEIEEF